MKQRREAKNESHRRILEVAVRRLRELGLDGAGVARIMSEAGLTHGGFYTHFGSKADLVVEALRAAFTTNRERWLQGLDRLDDRTFWRRVLRRYLNATHRDTPADGCPFPALAGDVARSEPKVRRAFEAEIMETVQRLAARLPARPSVKAQDQALALAALCGGGILLARAMDDQALSDQIIEACYDFALRGIERDDEIAGRDPRLRAVSGKPSLAIFA